jgi:hypothetical protein
MPDLAPDNGLNCREGPMKMGYAFHQKEPDALGIWTMVFG